MKNLVQFFGTIGLCFFGFGIVSLLLFGQSFQWLSLIQILIGVAGVAAFLFYYIGETWSALKRKKEAFFGVIGGGFLLFLLIGANVVAHSKLGERKFDLTTNKIHSLAEETQTLLKNLKSDISVTAFFKAGARERALVKDLVEKYTDLSNQVKFRAVDPEEEPGLVESLNAGPDTVVVRNEATGKSMKLTGLSEQDLTSAMKRVMAAESKKIYFLQGHGEGSFEDQEKGNGLYIAKILLENEGYSVQTLDATTSLSIPQDASAVVVWGAKRTIGKTTEEALLSYLNRGGRLVLGLDPLFGPTRDRLEASGLENILSSTGLAVMPAVIMEYQLQLLRGQVPSVTLLVRNFGSHEILSAFKNQATVQVHLAQAINQVPDYKGSANRSVLISSSDASWAEKDIRGLLVDRRVKKDGDPNGPFSLAQIAEWKVASDLKDKLSEDAKLVVFGDSDFASNELIQAGFNRDLFLNTFNVILGSEAPVTIRARTWTNSTLQISDGDRRLIYYAGLFVVPQLIITLGLLIWLTRRNRV